MDRRVLVRLVRPGAQLPAYATDGSAGADLRSAADGPVTVPARGRAVIPTGIAISLGSPELGAFLFARSGMAVKKGICLSNGVGVVDSDYPGEILVGLLNNSDEDFVVEPGDRVAQLVILPVERAAFLPARQLAQTGRGDGGFGSTGVK